MANNSVSVVNDLEVLTTNGYFILHEAGIQNPAGTNLFLKPFSQSISKIYFSIPKAFRAFITIHFIDLFRPSTLIRQFSSIAPSFSSP